MIPPPLPADEPRRLQALHRLCLLDTPAKERFDRIVRTPCWTQVSAVLVKSRASNAELRAAVLRLLHPADGSRPLPS
jgi:signal recognition particle receptor subunit beta